MNFYILYFKWLFLVSLNVIFSFTVAFSITGSIWGVIGIVMAILSFVLFYTLADLLLIKNKLLKWRSALHIAVIVKALLQFIFIVDMYIGLLSMKIGEFILSDIFHSQIGSSNLSELSVFYFVTMIDGMFLSVIVLTLTVMLNFMLFISKSPDKSLQGKFKNISLDLNHEK